MKKFFFILLILPLSFIAQIFKAGDILSGYHDIIPDTLLDFTFMGPQGGPYSYEHYFFDLNGDAISDLKIESFRMLSTGNVPKDINVVPLDTHVYIRFGRTDSIYNTASNSWLKSPIAKPLLTGDSINSLTAVWKKNLYLTRNTWYFNSLIKPLDWVGSIDNYIGIRYNFSSWTIYGWIRVNCPTSDGCYLKDYSFTKCANSPTLSVISTSSVLCASESATITASGASTYSWSTGSTNPDIIITPSVTTTYTIVGANTAGCKENIVVIQNVDPCAGITEYSVNSVKIYPNPVTNILHVFDEQKMNKPLVIEVTNYLGQVVLSQEYSGTIDVSQIQSGLYTLKIITSGDEKLYSKFVKE
jgi:hypothetical protein